MTHLEEDLEMMRGFVADGHELLDELEPDLIELHKSCEEGGTTDIDKLNAVFRLFHSLKGAAGFLKLHNVVKLTHEAEGMLNLVRDGSIMLTMDRTDQLCRACDFMRTLLGAIEKQGHDRGFEDPVNYFAAELNAAALDQTTAAALDLDASQPPVMTITAEMRLNYIQE